MASTSSGIDDGASGPKQDLKVSRSKPAHSASAALHGWWRRSVEKSSTSALKAPGIGSQLSGSSVPKRRRSRTASTGSWYVAYAGFDAQ